MLHINKIRNNPSEVAASLAKKGCMVDFSELLVWDADCRAKKSEVDKMKAERNSVSGQIPKLKKVGQPVDEIFAKMLELGDAIAEKDK